MKTTILTAILVIGCNYSAPAEDLSADECRVELVEERELSENCADDFDECENMLKMGDGEQVDLEPDGVVSVATDSDEVANLKSQIASLLAENERMAQRHSDELEAKDEQYNGLLDEYRDTQAKCGETASLFLEYQKLCSLDENGIWQTVEP